MPANPTPDEVREASREMKEEVIPLFRGIAMEEEGGGAYLNEANVDEPGWQKAFYGEKTYERLVGVKEKWDPRHVFYATTAVGSEVWKVGGEERDGAKTQNGRLCRVWEREKILAGKRKGEEGIEGTRE
jgi:hypothetical protein